jgi:hypothetical protein
VVRQSGGFWIEALPSFYELLSGLIGLREDAGMLDAVEGFLTTGWSLMKK